MSKNIDELPKYRKESGKAVTSKKERDIKDEPSVVVEKDDEEIMDDLKKMSESGKKDKKEEAFEYVEELKKMFKKPVERPAGVARLFGSAQGITKKIGDYFTEAKRWVEFQFAKKELMKGKTKESVFESIDKNEDPIDLTAFREVLEGTSEAVDSDVADFAERNENGLANLEAKAEEAEAGDEIPESTRKLMETLEREAEEAREEFKDEMGDEEYEARVKEAEELLGKDYLKVPSPKELREKIVAQRKEKAAKSGLKVPSPKELKEKIIAQKKEKAAKAGLKVPSPKELEEKHAKQKKESEDLLSTEQQLEVIADQIANLKERQKELKAKADKFRKQEEETRKKTGKYRQGVYKENQELINEVLEMEKEQKALEKKQKDLEKELKGVEAKFEKAFSKEDEEDDVIVEKEAEELSEKDVDVDEFEEEEEGEEKEEKGEAPFGKAIMDESHEKYLKVKEYEEKHGKAPEGESEDMYLSFSYKDYHEALKDNPKEASEMEEEMYEKLAMGSTKPKSQGRRDAPSGKIKTSLRGEKW